MGSRTTAAVVLAGGRIGGAYAAETGVTVKALAPWRAGCVVQAVAAALDSIDGLDSKVIVGPGDVRPFAGSCCFVEEEGQMLANVLAGLAATGARHERVLLIASDLPFVSSSTLQDFLNRCPDKADLSVPLIARSDMMRRFPFESDVHAYAPLRDGYLTMGGAAVVSPQAVRQNTALIQQVFDARKSHWRMAKLMGAGVVVRLITRTLSSRHLESRVSEVTQMRACAVRGCAPELAFDIDTLADYRGARANLGEPEPTGL